MAPFLAPPLLAQRRVVVTGIGMVTPLGNGVKATLSALMKGETGVRALQGQHDPTHPILPPDDSGSGDASPWGGLQSYPTPLAATVPEGEGSGLFSVKSQPQSVSRFVQFALAAAEEALHMARWEGGEGRNLRAGVSIGAGIGALEDVWAADRILREKGGGGRGGYRKLSPHFVPKILLNLAAGHVSIKHGLRGPNHSVVTACATGAHSIGDAFRFIKFGDADMMVAGGTEACVNHLSLAGFGRMRALSTGYNDQPAKASRPFDKGRDGFVVAEGAGVVVLEELHSALARGAPLLAEVRGYGLSGDANHITAPWEDGRGAVQSGLQPEHVGYLNAHATSTPLGDLAEGRAIDTVFGRRNSLLVSSTKGATGHLLGAAGAVEAALAMLAIRDGLAPPTLNLDDPDGDFGFTHVRVKDCSQPREIRAALSNSFGFGGTNASLLFSEPPPT